MLGLLALMIVVVVAVVRGVTDQAAEIGDSVDAAMEHAVATLEIDQEALDTARATVEKGAPALGTGFLTELVAGIDTLFGLASGVILGSLIMYYLLKDGSRLRRSVVEQLDPARQHEIDDFIGSTCQNLRDYGAGSDRHVRDRGRGHRAGEPRPGAAARVHDPGRQLRRRLHPLHRCLPRWGLAVVVALGEGGLDTAAIMLVAVVAANLLLENFVEPKVMGRTLDVHPLIVLVATALGGLLGGIVGLILAVPFYVIARDAISRLRAGGFFTSVATRAQPTVRAMLR